MTTNPKPILNPDFTPRADGWVQVAPLGIFPHKSGVVQVIDEKSVESMVNRFQEEKKSAGENFPGLLLDFDHFSGSTSTPSEAAGWIMDVQNRAADGMWGLPRWSDSGDDAVKGGRYRFISPSWKPADCEIVNRAAKQVRPLRLDRAALTNDYNLKGIAPITNRAGAVEQMMEPTVIEEEPLAARACTRDMLHNAGMSEGARKGGETRRAGGRAATKADVKKAVAAKAANKPKRAATKADLKKIAPVPKAPATPPPLPRSAVKANLPRKGPPPLPRAAVKADLPKLVKPNPFF